MRLGNFADALIFVNRADVKLGKSNYLNIVE